MYQALYRKWRPKTFDEVCGQDHITSILKYEVENGKVSHAYLLCGPRGTGKTSCAKLLAKAVNCKSPVNGNPCGKCSSCLAIDSSTVSDVIEMDAASNNGVDYIRDIREAVVYTPAELKYKVYIIDEVHMLSSGAFNALLKTLEEPPAYVIFILATTELHKLPATIVSRCQRFDFRRISNQVVAERVKEVCRSENLPIDDDAALIISRMSRGGMRDALSMLELCSASGGAITAESVSRSLGISSSEEVESFVDAIARRSIADAFRIIAKIDSSHIDISVFWQSVIEFYRNMIVIKTLSSSADYLELTAAETARCAELMKSFSYERLIYNARELDDCSSRMQRNSSQRRLYAEMSVLRLCDESFDGSASNLSVRVSALEEKISLLRNAPPDRRKNERKSEDEKSPTSTRQIPAEEKAESGKKEAVTDYDNTESVSESAPQRVYREFRAWPEAVELIGKENKAVSSFLRSASVITDGERYIIKMGNSFAADMVSRPDSLEIVANAVSSVTSSDTSPSDIEVRTEKTDFNAKKDILSDLN
ncbi:MAG: DNA polymerase III subunit gamma/tau [Clostridia bacterium]|nr:DNA polymerase III subunit gamma/tau [Clostridia bacterium]